MFLNDCKNIYFILRVYLEKYNNYFINNAYVMYFQYVI